METGTPERNDVGQYRLQTFQFFLGRDRLRAIGPGGFRADVDDVGALGDHSPGLRQRALRRDESSAIGEMRSGVTFRTPMTAGYGRDSSAPATPDDLPGWPRGGSGRGRDHAVALRGPRMGVKMPDVPIRAPAERR